MTQASTLSKRPTDVGVVSGAVLDILAPLTMFPWPLLKTQAERRNLDPANLSPTEFALILEDVVAALERFTSPQKAATARQAFLLLVAGPSDA